MFRVQKYKDDRYGVAYMLARKTEIGNFGNYENNNRATGTIIYMKKHPLVMIKRC